MSKIDELEPGFVLVPDVLLRRFGPATAVVWGRIYRYSGEKGHSYASQETIAKEVGMSVRAVRDHIKKLLETSCIFDLTPDKRNSPHHYEPHMNYINTQQKDFIDYKKEIKRKEERKLANQRTKLKEESVQFIDNRFWTTDDELDNDLEEIAGEEIRETDSKTQPLARENENPNTVTLPPGGKQFNHSESEKVAVEYTIEDTKKDIKNIEFKKEEKAISRLSEPVDNESRAIAESSDMAAAAIAADDVSASSVSESSIESEIDRGVLAKSDSLSSDEELVSIEEDVLQIDDLFTGEEICLEKFKLLSSVDLDQATFSNDQVKIITKVLFDSYPLEERLSKICSFIQGVLFMHAQVSKSDNLLPETRHQYLFLKLLAADSFSSQESKMIFSYLENAYLSNSIMLERIPTHSDSIAVEWLFIQYNYKFYVSAFIIEGLSF